tara:strand:- start:21 stop:410 length:390 start_codon:yes stop_codon:yes gene_type:complete
MSDRFNFEVISPDKTIIKTEVDQVTLPGFEGLMTLLKDHIPIVTFLRPGIIEAEINSKNEKFYVEEGTVEFSNNNLLVLSSTIKNIDNITKDEANKMIESAKKAIASGDIKDKERYVLSYKIETLQEIN